MCNSCNTLCPELILYGLLDHMSIVLFMKLQGFTTMSSISFLFLPHFFCVFHGVVPYVNTL